MMKTSKQKNVKLLLAAVLMGFSALSYAQTENPRGIYKLMALKGKKELRPYVADIYKIITDSVTMRLMVADNDKQRFRIDIPDFKPFNYTGERTSAEDNDRSQQVYDSDSTRFTQKWWCNTEVPTHPIFPYNDWCYEFYESGCYTPEGDAIFKAINTVHADSMNPFIGTWQILATIENQQKENAEELVKRLQKVDNLVDVLMFLSNNSVGHNRFNEYMLFTPSHLVTTMQPKNMHLVLGTISGVSYNGNDAFALCDGNTYKIYWLLDGSFVQQVQIDDKIFSRVLKRLSDDQTFLSRISSDFITLNKSLSK